MGNNAVSPYQQVIEKTKSLSFRSQMLAMNIEKKLAHSNRNEVTRRPNPATEPGGESLCVRDKVFDSQQQLVCHQQNLLFLTVLH